MSAANEKLVSDFCQAWSRKNVDAVLGYLADDCFYYNIPMEPCVGKEAIRKFVAPFLFHQTDQLSSEPGEAERIQR